MRVGPYMVKVFADEKVLNHKKWRKTLGWYQRTETGFTLGPFIAYKNPYETKSGTLNGLPVRVTWEYGRKGKLVAVEVWPKTDDGSKAYWVLNGSSIGIHPEGRP